MTAPAGPTPRRRGLFIPGMVLLGALVVLIGLGTWQLERRGWKEALIAELDRKLAAPPVDLPPRERWPQLNAATDERDNSGWYVLMPGNADNHSRLCCAKAQ